MNAVVSAFRWHDTAAWKRELHEPLTSTTAGTLSSTFLSFRGYRRLSVSGGSFQCPR